MKSIYRIRIRRHSKRIPKKCIHKIDEKPLITHTIKI